MSRNARLALIACGAAVWLLTPEARAICNVPYLFSSLSQDGYSYVITPGISGTSAAHNDSSVSTRLDGYFWKLGAGDPKFDSGVDNGRFGPLPTDPDDVWTGWVRTNGVHGGPAYVFSSWAASQFIDGCIRLSSGLASAPCMAMVLGDVDGQDQSVFTVATTRATAVQSDYFFNQVDDVPIVLAPVPAATLASITPGGPDRALVVVKGPEAKELEAGLLLDETCGSSAVVGYRIVGLKDEVADDADLAHRDNWEALGTVVPFGEPSTVVTDCPGGSSLMLGTSLVFDSGFETPFVAVHPAVECPPSGVDSDAPFQLLTFTAAASHDGVRVRWQTAHEKSGAEFRLLRSVGAPHARGAALVIVGRRPIVPNGTGPGGGAYEILDRGEGIDAGVRYYLEYVDRLGVATRLGPFSIAGSRGATGECDPN